MTHLDLFAGILGFTIGAERAGFKTLACSEKDAFCSSVIAHRRPALPNLGDITQLDGRALQGHVDIGLHYGHAHLDGLTGCAILNGERGPRSLQDRSVPAVVDAVPLWLRGSGRRLHALHR